MIKEKNKFELIFENVTANYALTKNWPSKYIYDLLVKYSEPQQIKLSLSDKNCADFEFSLLISIYSEVNDNDFLFLKQLLQDNLQNELKLDYILRTIIYLFHHKMKNIPPPNDFGDLLESIFDKYYYDELEKSQNKLKFNTPCSVWLVEMLISLFGKLNYVKVIDKLKNIIKTQKENEPKLYYASMEAIKKMKSNGL